MKSLPKIMLIFYIIFAVLDILFLMRLALVGNIFYVSIPTAILLFAGILHALRSREKEQTSRSDALFIILFVLNVLVLIGLGMMSLFFVVIE